MQLLNQCSIKTNGKVNHKGFMQILCPFHNDKHYGSCDIHINTGTISCFVCGKHHISTLLNKHNINININFEFKKFEKEEEVKKTISDRFNISKNDYNFVYKKINPKDYYYTRQRGFTQEFIDTFQIVRCFSFPYEDYFAVLIKDTAKNIIAIEFRRLMEFEYLQKLFNTPYKNFEDLKGAFKKYIEQNNIYYNTFGEICRRNEIIYDKNLEYLLQSKVLYEKNSALKETLLNIDNLNYKEDLYLVEGIGSLSKIWTHISKNCTCTFGSQISQAQIDYLKQFKKIIIIPDRDKAGYDMTNTIYKQCGNLYVIDIPFEDTDDEYAPAIQNTNHITVNEYVEKYSNKYRNQKKK